MQARYITATLSVLSTVFNVTDLINDYILPFSRTDNDRVCIIILQYLSYTMLGQDGTTALSAAARGGCAPVVALLLNAKADVNHADNVRHDAAIRMDLMILSYCMISNADLLSSYSTWYNVLLSMDAIFITY
jgi:hypothetical protein